MGLMCNQYKRRRAERQKKKSICLYTAKELYWNLRRTDCMDIVMLYICREKRKLRFATAEA